LDPLVKQILNGLRCPVCQGQVDLIDWKHSGKRFNYCCANDYEHYQLWFVHWEPVIRIEHECVIIYEGHHKYIVWQFHGTVDMTHIYTYEIDAECNVLDQPNPTPATVFNKLLFDFAKTNRENLVNRLKTILVFQ
jgi:hypothetical protein